MAAEASNIEWIDIGVEGLLEFIPGLPKGDAILVTPDGHTHVVEFVEREDEDHNVRS